MKEFTIDLSCYTEVDEDFWDTLYHYVNEIQNNLCISFVFYNTKYFDKLFDKLTVYCLKNDEKINAMIFSETTETHRYFVDTNFILSLEEKFFDSKIIKIKKEI
jgi:hypothetical protein